jgi:hypothetical protein
MSNIEPNKHARASHIWAREKHEHYVEEPWLSRRLFEEEHFEREIFDPCCGFGHIVESARAAGLPAYGSDLVDRGYAETTIGDFLLSGSTKHDNIVMNPPFDKSREFIERALCLGLEKVASIYPTRRLNAASWLAETTLKTIWLITPRPSMPPGSVYRLYEAAKMRPSGGTMDFCWLVFERGFVGDPTINWLHRDL